MLLRKALMQVSAVGMAVLVSVLTSGAQVKAEENILTQNNTNKSAVESTVAQYPRRGRRIALQRLYQQRSYYRRLARRWERTRNYRYRICRRNGGSWRWCRRAYWRENPYAARIWRINRRIWRLERGYDYYNYY
ncbi:hypothetical protein [Calothrix rhizosoleniae]|uniref:hypothetical protein n=1 Tax=Calothrix rhizosoleniae TaxID=888997 RepID=UPI000B49E61B|nr:hypothetical protein [Calothrix rhizosoleniae]